MSCDDNGEIQLSLDPYDDLPPNVATTLESLVLVPDYDVASRGIDALEFVLELWDDLEEEEEEEEIESWAKSRAGRPIVLGCDESGVLEETDDISYGAHLPAETVALLTQEVLSQPEAVRVAAIEAMRELIGEWGALITDEEKMLGHLLLRHGQAPNLTAQSHDELIRIHAEQHQLSRTE